MGKIVVLMYNLDNDKGKKIEQFCRGMGLGTVAVEKEAYNKPIETLLSAKSEESAADNSTEDSVSEDKAVSIEAAASDNAFEDEMLVMCGFNRRLLDIFLSEYKKRHIEPVSLKAILTEHNRKWSSMQLHAELCRERAAFTKR